jgi:hypothetical protein
MSSSDAEFQRSGHPGPGPSREGQHSSCLAAPCSVFKFQDIVQFEGPSVNLLLNKLSALFVGSGSAAALFVIDRDPVRAY